MFNIQLTVKPTVIILDSGNLFEVAKRYPHTFKLMLPKIVACVIQGLDDVGDIKDRLYEDGCEGLLVEHCHCGGRMSGCSDCEDSMHIDSLACGFIDAVSNVLVYNPDVLDQLREFTSSDTFTDFDVRFVDVGSIVLEKHNG